MEDDKGTAVATQDERMNLTALGMGHIKSLGDAFFKSGVFPDVTSEAQAIVKVIAGQELALPPVYSMQNFYIIKGRLAMSAETMSLLLKRNGAYSWKVLSHSDEECSIQFYERGDGKWSEIYLSKFTIADAKRAGLVRPDSNYMKFPKAMMFSRAMSQGSRIVAPHLMGGTYSIEEVESITPDALAEIEGPPEPEKPKPRKTGRKKAEEVAPVMQQAEREATDQAEAASPTAETEAPAGGDTQEPSTAVEVTPPEPPVEPTTTKVEFKRDPDTIKTIADMYAALWHDYELQPAKVMKELGVKSNQEISDTPPNCYRIVATVYGARPEGA